MPGIFKLVFPTYRAIRDFVLKLYIVTIAINLKIQPRFRVNYCAYGEENTL